MKRTENSPFLDRILTWSLDHPMPALRRYLIATLVILMIAVVRAAFVTELLPWLLFIPAVVGITLILGEGTGLYASLLATFAAAITLGTFVQEYYLTGQQWAGSVLFLITAGGLARVVGELRAAFRRARALNVELSEREAFTSSVLASSTDCIKVIDLDGRLSFMSEGGMKVMEVSDFNDIKGCPWPDFWQDAGNTEARNAIANAKLGLTSHFTGKADTFLGTPRWWDVSVSPILGPDGKPDRILSVSRDMTALLEAREQQQLLNGELGHRLKNVLALVQSIANQTFRQSDSVEEANAAFASRLAALGKATDVLTSTAWRSAHLDDIVRAGLTSVEGLGDRVQTGGPAMKLDSQVALALTLALHELATNACKYGALSNDSGMVSLIWDYEAVENTSDTRFSLQWQERGGPPVLPPTRKGFGSKMIERSLRSYFRGETSLSFDPAGVVFRIDAPLPKSGASVA
ncbi:HWE histidine kinase domain-containing protein [Sphingomonas immobilis]|uniref:histidine kinase n=1 Tax=Sphingomonas immobilis TaxID=3063997 RepID=A0ABT8ZXZ2_9SPHN|nr:HWE histidine kinase domain-containing protein [Sphingomonas sp. CA1-15]MDO7841880.1 HWE histidine kinase domain-containing protein [Sphingomonas sp. CA1-15]